MCVPVEILVRMVQYRLAASIALPGSSFGLSPPNCKMITDTARIKSSQCRISYVWVRMCYYYYVT
jgi:hypothetical protein